MEQDTTSQENVKTEGDNENVDIPVKNTARKVKNYPKKLSRTSTAIQVTPSIPKHRENIRWCGWGFGDSGFCARNGMIMFKGDRYGDLSGKKFPYLHEYLLDKFDVDIPKNFDARNYPEPNAKDYPTSKFPKEWLDDILYLGIDVTTKGIDRLRRAGGQAFDDVWKLLDMSKIRIPDAVAWPTCHEEVVELVKLANERNFVIIPYGGGTSVAGALILSNDEMRPILSVDTNQMHEILCVDRENMLVTAETGIIGQDLERHLNEIGFTTGHDPDSSEISTLGGWVSTRASGMKQSKYGNIEDLTVHMKLVTSQGVYEKGSKTGRMSCGPDMNHMILGSEGMFGIITEVTLKIHKVPECVVYDSILFPDFHTGIKFMREMTRRKWQPANIRMLDEEQFQIGMALRSDKPKMDQFMEKFKMKVLEIVKGFDLKKMGALTIVYEGTKDDVQAHVKKLTKLAVDMGGIPAGSKAGEAGYTSMSVAVSYVRDIALEFNIIADSIETTVPWDKVEELDVKIKDAIKTESIRLGVLKPKGMARISQTYDAGCCYYVNLGIRVPVGGDIITVINRIKHVVKEICVANGASVSHHHGIGKQKKYWYEDFVSLTGANVLRAAKLQLDPKNIFASRNFLDDYTIKKSEEPSLDVPKGTVQSKL